MSHDPSEIILICWFAAQEIFIIISVENSCAALYFCENQLHFFDILNVTVDQLNALFAE